MDSNAIRLAAIQEVNGLKHLPSPMVNSVKFIVCKKLGIENSEENFKHVEDGIRAYFDSMNQVGINGR